MALKYVAIAAAVALGGCASMIPKPPDYTGTDSVEAVSMTDLVGEWRMVALNPIDDEEVPERRIDYAADGSFTAQIQPTAEMAEAMGGEPIVMSGSWRVDGGDLVHDTTELDVAGDDFASRMVRSIMQSRPPITARANVYDLERDRIVIVSEDGYANELQRL